MFETLISVIETAIISANKHVIAQTGKMQVTKYYHASNKNTYTV